MPIWPCVMAGKNDNNKLHQDYLSCKGTDHLGGCLGGHIAIFHVYFGGHLGGCLPIKSVLHLIVMVACTGGLVML